MSTPWQPTGGREPENPWASPAPAPPPPWGPPASYQHPQGSLVLALGILSVVLMPLLGPIAWLMGRAALREVDASRTPVANRSSLVAGMVLGIIGTAITAIGLLWFLVAIGVVAALL